jgi:hypothetical protein
MLLIGAAVVPLLLTATAATIDPGLARPGGSHFLASGVVMCLVDLAVAIGFTALALQAPARPTVLRWLGGALLVAGSFGTVPAEALLRVDFDLGNAVFGVVGPAQALGLVLFGIAVVVARQWTSWRRFAPLALGLYVPFVMMPLLIASQGLSLGALAGYHAFVLAVGIAYLRESTRA